MNHGIRSNMKLLACAGGLLVLGVAAAQSTGGETAPTASSALTSLTIPALMTPRADKALLLGIAKAGKELVAVGGNGVIVRSADGKTWTQSPNPTDTALNAVSFADDKNGWAVGHDAVILGTVDGGASWQVQNLQPDLFVPMFSVQAIDAASAIAVGAFGTFKRTADGGKTWSDEAPPEITDEKLHLNAIVRLPSGKFVVTGERGLVGVSSDGQVWKRIAIPYEGSFFGVLPWGAQGAIAFGMRGNAYATADVESADWQKIETGTTNSFFGGQALSDGAVLLTGSEGTLLKISASGEAVSQSDVGRSAGTLTGIATLDSARVVIGELGVRLMPQQ